MKGKPKTCEIEVNNIWYLYAVGAMWITIHTAPREKQYGALPEYAQVQTIAQTPEGLRDLTPTTQVVKDAVDRIIRDKVREQRRRAEGRV